MKMENDNVQKFERKKVVLYDEFVLVKLKSDESKH